MHALLGTTLASGFSISHLLNVTSLLHSFGPWVLLGIGVLIFIESGVLFPFLPGDSLILTAVIISSTLGINPWEVALVGSVAAILGSEVGYWFGDRFGRRLFKENARVLNTKNLHETEAFFVKYGGLSLVLGRFVPIVRTYVPFAAGIGTMRHRTFFWWNSAGAIVWNVVLTVVGILLGKIPFVAKNIDVIMIIVVLVSVVPVVIAGLNKRAKAKKAETTGATPIVDASRG